MKRSLRKAILLFSVTEQIAIVFGLLYFKLGFKIPSRSAKLLAACNDYVRLIEQGVNFRKVSKQLCKASLLINQKYFSVFLRKNSSDLPVFESVLQNEEYKIAAQHLASNGENQEKIIVDAGGNIGLTCIYLFAFFPGSKFFVIEPDEKNFALLQMNLKENKITSAILFKKALWTSDEKLILDDSFRDGKEWSLTVKQAAFNSSLTGYNSIEGITLHEICALQKIPQIDMLKIDIEGAERFLFANAAFLETLDLCVSAVVIEIHDEFNIRQSIYNEMSKLRFSKKDHGDITLFSKYAA